MVLINDYGRGSSSIKVVCSSKIKNEESKIVVGVTHKNYRKCFLQTDDDKVLFWNKYGNYDFLNINLMKLAESKDKPILVIYDRYNEILLTQKVFLQNQGYESHLINLDKINFNILEVVYQKIDYIRKLNNNIINDRGKYFLAGEVYLSYEEILKKVKTLKEEVLIMMEKTILTFYEINGQDKLIFLVRSLIIRILEDWSEKGIEKAPTMVDVIEETNILLKKSGLSFRRYLLKTDDDGYQIKKRFKMDKVTTNDLNIQMEAIKTEHQRLLPIFSYPIIFTFNNQVASKQAFFISGENKKVLKLFLSFIENCELEGKCYFLIESDQYIVQDLKYFNIIWIIKKLNDQFDYNFFQTKVLGGTIIEEDKKDLLILCKDNINGILTKNYVQIFNLIKLFISLDIKKEEVLVINDNNKIMKTKFVSNFQIKKLDTDTVKLMRKYKEEI